MKERIISFSVLGALMLVVAPAYAAEIEANTATSLTAITPVAQTDVSVRANLIAEARKCRALTDRAERADCYTKLRVSLSGSSNATIRPRPLHRPVAKWLVNLPEDLQKRIEACRAETDMEAKKECRMKLRDLIKEQKQANRPAAWPESLKADIQVCRRDNRPNRIALITCIKAAFTAAGIDMPEQGPWTNIGHTRKRVRQNISADTRTHLKECREKSNGDIKVFRECAASVLGNGSLANTRLPHRFTKYNNSPAPSVKASAEASVKTQITPFSVKPIKSLTRPSLTPTW